MTANARTRTPTMNMDMMCVSGLGCWKFRDRVASQQAHVMLHHRHFTCTACRECSIECSPDCGNTTERIHNMFGAKSPYLGLHAVSSCAPGVPSLFGKSGGEPVGSSYKRVKGRSHTVEKRLNMHPHKPHATSQPSRLSHTYRPRTHSPHNQHSH